MNCCVRRRRRSRDRGRTGLGPARGNESLPIWQGQGHCAVTSSRVLVVEDDPSVRRFVQMALEPLGAELVQCATLAEARRALEAGWAQVVLTDLSLPDGSGLDLLAWMQAVPGATDRPACRTVVFSGGIDPVAERNLAGLGVWRVLRKPASVGALMACVSEALLSVAEPEPHVEAVARGRACDPVAEFFGGNRVLFDTYRRACQKQFLVDLRAGDAAASARDCAALRHVAHNLKSVLTMLGELHAADCARSAEESAAGGASEAMVQDWHRLRSHIAQLI